MGTRPPLTLPQGPNRRWRLDVVSYMFAGGQRIRVPAAVDDVTRKCLALVADMSRSGARVVRALDTIIAARASR